MRIDEPESPIPCNGEISVDVGAAGINFPDVPGISGKYQALSQRLFVPGKDLAGVVRAEGHEMTGFVFWLWTAGSLRPHLTTQFSFEELPMTLESISRGKHQSKAVVSFADPSQWTFQETAR
jgi:NADPH:quinone reductase-like Zn-dependent oxidoreductase